MTFKNPLHLAVAISEFGRKMGGFDVFVAADMPGADVCPWGLSNSSNRRATECDCLNGGVSEWQLGSAVTMVTTGGCLFVLLEWLTVVAINVAFCFSRYSPFNITMCERITCGFEQTAKPKY